MPYVPTHRLHSLGYLAGNLVDITMVKAPQPLFTVGGKDVLPRGDAFGTTDPISGHGAKIAIESALSDQFYLQMNAHEGSKELSRVLFKEMAEAYLSKAQVQGFFMRAKMHEHTEAYAYFMELGRTKGWMTSSEIDLLSALFDRAQLALEDLDFAKYLAGEEASLQELRQKIYSQLKEVKIAEYNPEKKKIEEMIDLLKQPLEPFSSR